MSHEVPEGWKLNPLTDLANYINGRAFKPEDWVSSGLPIIRIANMTNSDAAFNFYEGEDIDDGHLVRNGDILFSWSATLSIQKWTRGAAVLNQHIFKVVPAESVQPDWLLYVLQNEVERLADQSHGSTMKHIKKGVLKTHHVGVPPLHEQRRIAEVLSSVDEVIAATRAVIEQTRKVKQGVLERLLTKGIGHTRFKQTEIGEIPEGWDLATLEELLADIPNPMRSGPFGSALKSEELVETGIPFLGIDNIQVEQFIRNYKRFLSEDKFRQLRRFAVNPNDVVITIMGTVGRCCVVPPDIGEAVSSKHIWAMSLDHERYIPDLACWQMNFAPWIVSKFTTSAQGGIMSAINSGILRKLVFPVPGLEEQRQILQIWQSFQRELQVEQAKLQNLEELKSALMSDVLTGRKRVTDTLLMAAE
ncbi:restriction endonuclease subunit S [Agrobacterium sp. P15N1-A]|uniref:restriction endonuclease subunit S n=1 Tax=Agrobacterium sp. P15N1-A TaxID=3342820 RepID=UPI0037D122B3